MKREYLYAGGAVLALVLGYVVYRKFGNALATTFNPASDQNAAYKGVNALGHATGLIDEDDTLGTAIYGAVDTVAGWFGMSDADKQRKAEEDARALRNSGGSYDYGTAGDPGIPWRYDAKPLPNIFNYDLGYLYR